MQQLDDIQKEFVSEQTMLKIDRASGEMSVTPILSWHEAEFVAAYDKGDEGPLAAAIADRARRRGLHQPNLLPLEKELVQKNQFKVTYHPFDWRLNDLTGGRGAVAMDLALTDKVAIVTGSSRGLGLASARTLVAEGCRVCICARGRSAWPKRRWKSKRGARRPNMVMTVQADVSTADGIALVVDRDGRAVRRPRHPGQQRRARRRRGLLDTSDAEWQAAFDETLFPAIRASRLAVPHMKARGGGAIIMIASIWGRESGGRMTYNAVKAAEISLAKSLAQQLAPLNIRVNSVAPGSILFPGGSWHTRQQADPAGHRRVHQARPAVRPLRPPRGSRRRRRVPRLRRGPAG